MSIPKTITVEVDTREQYPVLFPATVKVPHPTRPGAEVVVQVKVKKTKLECGDYRLAEYPTGCVIERKASQFELFKNLCDPLDSVRQAKSFNKLVLCCDYPYLLIEAGPSDLLTVGKQVKCPQRVVAGLCEVLVKYQFGVLWIPWGRTTASRRKLGTVMVHLMLAYGLKNSENPIDTEPGLL